MATLCEEMVKRLHVSVIMIVIGIVGMMFILGCTLVPDKTEQEIVVFNDKILESAIVATLSGESVCSPDEMAASGEMAASNGIMTMELAELTSLCVGNRGVTDLYGLEHCTNLTVLNLDRNEISDISVLSSLTDITVLGLAGNQVSDISALATLNNLEYLYLGENQISDVSALHSLNNLNVLSIYSNRISDISPLGSLGELTLFDIRDNPIKDISPLASLEKLTVINLSTDFISQGSETMQYVKSLQDRGVVVRHDPLPGTN